MMSKLKEVTLVMGLQYGDEGKAKVVDWLSHRTGAGCVRYQGGDNAGHTIVDEDGNKFICHALPAAAIHNSKCFITRGCVLNIEQLNKEVVEAEQRFGFDRKNLYIDSNTPLILPYHIEEDVQNYQKTIGTTARGIGPAYQDFYGRLGMMAKDLKDKDIWDEKLTKILPKKFPMWNPHLYEDVLTGLNNYFETAQQYLDNIIDFRKTGILYEQEKLVFESAQGHGLDVFVGEHPYVTSSTVGVGAAISSSGIGPEWFTEGLIVGVFKPYKTYVGEGEFKTESKTLSEALRGPANEFGATTGRPRRIGHLDLLEVLSAIAENSVGSLVLTKLDVMNNVDKISVWDGEHYLVFESWDEDISDVREYEKLPANAIKFVEWLMVNIDPKIEGISVGPRRDQMITDMSPGYYNALV